VAVGPPGAGVGLGVCLKGEPIIMTTPTVRHATAETLLAIRQLCQAICAARTDGRHLMARLECGGLRIVLDERSGVIAIGLRQPDGDVDWIETVTCDPTEEAEFGLMVSQALSVGSTH
jgi:hypothetical protein